MSRLGRELLKGLRSAVAEDVGTWQLYKDEPFFKRLSKVLYTSDLLDPFFKVYYSIDTFIANIARVLKYAPLIWRHRNWDHGFVLKMNIQLYEDLYKGCYVDGNHIFKKSEARKLRTVINLLKRLSEDNYDEWQYDYLNKKYGESEFYFTKIAGTEDKPGGPYSTMQSTRDDRMTPAQREAYIKERKAMFQLEEYQRKQDLKLLGQYIAKYSQKWWD